MMDNRIIAAIIVAAGLVVAVSIYMFFSPYHSCVRELGPRAAVMCLGNSN